LKTVPQQKEFFFLVSDELAGIRLDKALAQHAEIESRSQATSLIDRGFVTLNDKVVKPAHKTQSGENFRVQLPFNEPTELIPYDFALDIVYEDDSVIVVNKPSGLVVHPAVGHRQDTLVNALLHHTNDLATGFAEGRPGLVHRIDKDTSGIIVIAKTDTALRSLAAQFKKKTVHRIYWLVVYGKPAKPTGTITSYIRRSPIDRKKFASEKMTGHAEPEGKLAITLYAVKKTHPSGLSLVHCRLETGRTHQIRVHMSESGHPIIADPVYCSDHRYKSLNSVHMRDVVQKIPHLMLHAAELGFIHPETRKEVRFKAPWPEELLPFIREVEFENV
jgi:23S rRNA pseudouridine1911/1915/1917 synthase